MKTCLTLLFLAGCLTAARAELKDTVEHLDRGQKGVADKLVVARDGETIYERFVQDRNRDGVFDNYIETFTVGGKKILQFTFISGARGTLLYPDTGAQVIFDSEKESWRPDTLYIELKDQRVEMYALQPDGFFRPVNNEKKKQYESVVQTTHELVDAMFKGDAKGATQAVKKLQSTSAPKADKTP